MRNFTKRTATVAIAAVALSGVGVAYAYWTTQGTGTGSASTTSVQTADKIDLDQVGTYTGFYPDGPAQTVKVTATNPALFDQRVGEVTVAVADAGTCLAGNWAVVNIADDIGVLQPSGVSSATDVATVQLIDDGSNQDECQGVSPVLTFTSASSE